MIAIDLFTLMAKIGLDSSEFDRGIGAATSKGESFGSKFGSVALGVGKAVVSGLAVAGAAFTGLTVKALELGGSLEQNIGGSEAVFGSFADTVQNKAVAAFDQMGISTSNYLATANKMGALMQGAGLDIETSMDLSTAAMQRAADVASIMGISTESAMESIAGAAKGNFTMMDNLGVAMNATTIEAYALSKGIETSYSEMDNATKVGLAMEMFLEKTAYAAGNYAKENETLAGSLSTAGAAMQNFLDGSGDVDQLVDAFSNAANVIVENLTTLLPRLTTGLTELIQGIIPLVPPLLATLLPSVIEGAVALMDGLMTAFPEIVQVLSDMLPMIIDAILTMLPMLMEVGIQIIVTLAEAIAENAPELIPVAVETILTLVEALINNVDLMVDASVALAIGLANGLMAAIPVLLEKAPLIVAQLVMAIISNAPKLIEASARIILEFTNGIWSRIAEVRHSGEKILENVYNSIINLVGRIVSAGQDIARGFVDGIMSMAGWVWDQVSSFFGGIVDGVKDFLGIHSPSTVFADFGKNTGRGFVNGVLSMADAVNNAVDSVFGDLGDDVEFGAQFAGAGGFGVTSFGTASQLGGRMSTPIQIINNNVISNGLDIEMVSRKLANQTTNALRERGIVPL